ncbi:hypothetical protein [Kribbella sp. NPDC048915]|uniref:hypothetical protein n=1 Tax=Kribbella sp. NPDC048915 TaxID=3155148 RepID=UPI0033CF9902
MSQPTETPRQANWADALDRLGTFTPQQWENLATLTQLQQDAFDRLIQQAQKVPLKDRLHEKIQSVTGRVQALYVQTRERLSEKAQQLQSQAGQFLQTQRDRGTEFAQNVAGVAQAGQEWAGRQVQAGREWAGQQAQAVGQWAGQQRDRGVAFAGQVAETGRNVRDAASRWFQTQKTRVSIAAEGARATVAAMRFDRDMPQGTTTKDLTELSQQYGRVMAGPTLEERLAAAQQVVQKLQAQVDAQTQSTDPAMRAALSGVAPAGSAPAQPQAVTGQQSGEQAGTTSLKKPERPDLQR